MISERDQERVCGECGRDMAFIDHVCYGKCLGCCSEEERERYIRIIEERNVTQDTPEPSKISSMDRSGKSVDKDEMAKFLAASNNQQNGSKNRENTKVISF